MRTRNDECLARHDPDGNRRQLLTSYLLSLTSVGLSRDIITHC
jgi:hypothetical protein